MLSKTGYSVEIELDGHCIRNIKGLQVTVSCGIILKVAHSYKDQSTCHLILSESTALATPSLPLALEPFIDLRPR